MKHLQTFESFVKNYGEKMSPEQFAELPVGSTVLFKGARYTVEENNNGATIVLKPVKGGSPVMVNLNQFIQGGAIVESFESYLDYQGVNESAVDALFILMQTIMLSGPVIALGIKNGAFDNMRTPKQVIQDWQRDRIVGPAVERLSKDPEVIEFLKLSGTQQRGKWQELITPKLTDKELKHINSISRYRVRDGKI